VNRFFKLLLLLSLLLFLGTIEIGAQQGTPPEPVPPKTTQQPPSKPGETSGAEGTSKHASKHKKHKKHKKAPASNSGAPETPK